LYIHTLYIFYYYLEISKYAFFHFLSFQCCHPDR
jgi:hypothetical protein